MFTVPEAVDVWDAEFRWRDAGGLRDLTIDDTWRRIADGAASAEAYERRLWSHRFCDSFSRWRLLPDEAILAALGTDKPMPALAEPGAVLNVAAFVVRQPFVDAWFDRERFVATASLAVRLLDDVVLASRADPPARRLGIGLIGLADALEALGMDYSESCARHQGMLVAQALAEGCLLGSVELAEERGARISLQHDPARVEALVQRQMPDWLIERAIRNGLSHVALTAIRPHPALARLANCVADGVEPPLSMQARSLDYRQRIHAAEVMLRARIQPWIDAPIAASALGVRPAPPRSRGP